MDGRTGFRITPRLVFGFVIIMFGILFLLDNLKILEAEEILPYWPVILLAIGLVKLLGSGTPAARAASAFWLLGGTLLLLINLGFFNFKVLWPFLLVLLGGWIVLRALTSSGSHSRTVDSSSTLSSFALMGGVERKNASKEFKGGEATAIMGGCEIDLRDASIAGDEAVMDVFAFWGGVDIIVPGDWTVVTTATPIMGGIEDKRKTVGSDPTKRLVVKGLAIMGGVEISN